MTNSNLRFTMLIKRKPDISEEEFHKYWTEVHPSVVNEWLVKHGVVQYIQYHIPSSHRAQSEEVWTELGSDHVSDFDGHVVLTVPSLDALKNALADPYYKSHVQPDEAKFIDSKSCYRTFGYEHVYIKDKQIVSNDCSVWPVCTGTSAKKYKSPHLSPTPASEPASTAPTNTPSELHQRAEIERKVCRCCHEPAAR